MLRWLKSLFASGHTVLVSIPVADSFPNEEELAARNAIMDWLDKRDFGKMIGAGGGFSQMDFKYQVTDDAEARRLIEEALPKFLPGKEYEVTFE